MSLKVIHYYIAIEKKDRDELIDRITFWVGSREKAEKIMDYIIGYLDLDVDEWGGKDDKRNN